MKKNSEEKRCVSSGRVKGLNGVNDEFTVSLYVTILVPLSKLKRRRGRAESLFAPL